MVNCSVRGCKNRSENKHENITFHTFPQDAAVRPVWLRATGRHNWTPTKYSRICSKHFEDLCFRKTAHKVYLDIFSVPTLFLHTPSGSDSGSATPVNDPEEDEVDETPIQPDDQKDLSIVIQDALTQGCDRGSFKQLHAHQPGAAHSRIYVQPSTSTVIKEEIDEDFIDYKALYYKLLDEHMALKNHQFQESQALIEANKSLGEETGTFIGSNQKYKNNMQQFACDYESLLKKNQIFAESLSDDQNDNKTDLKVNIFNGYIEKIDKTNRSLGEETETFIGPNQKSANDMQQFACDYERLLEKNQNFAESLSDEQNDKNTHIKVNVFNGYIEKIDNLNEKIQHLTEENKSLVERNKSLVESMKQITQENYNLKMNTKEQQKFILTLNNRYNYKLETKSREIKYLRQHLSQLKGSP